MRPRKDRPNSSSDSVLDPVAELRGQQVLALQMIAKFVLPASRPECDTDRAEKRLPHPRPFEQRDAIRRADRFEDSRDRRRHTTTADKQDQREIRPGRLLGQGSDQPIECGRSESFLGDDGRTRTLLDAPAERTNRRTNPGRKSSLRQDTCSYRGIATARGQHEDAHWVTVEADLPPCHECPRCAWLPV
jgi:hypothetical protein